MTFPPHRRSTTRRLGAGLAALLLTGTLAACGSSPSRSAATSSAAHPRTPSASTARAWTSPQGAGSASAAASVPMGSGGVPRFRHVIVVVEENHADAEIIGNSAAPYMNALARGGALLTQSYAVTHPSYPNYLALFSGSTHGITNDSCPHSYSGNNLGAQVRAKGFSFTGYAQSLPSAGYLGCTYGKYARRHAPWVDFPNIPRSLSQPMTAFPADFTKLPRLAFVIPDLDHDMHDGTIGQADSWLKARLGAYASWARSNGSLLIVTWDEDDRSAGNHIPTIVSGAYVKAGRYGMHVDHYRVLRTLEASFGVAALGVAANRTPISTIWTS